MQHRIEMYGHTYTVQTNANGKITHIGCDYRWPLSELKWIGCDQWLIEELQRRIDAMKD